MGESRLANSAAAVNLQQARRMAVENREEAIRSYYRAKQINAEYRKSNLRPASRRSETTTASHSGTRSAPVIEVLDAIGTVAWPEALQRPCFARHRLGIERIVQGTTGESQEELTLLCSDLKAELKQRIREFSPSEYIAAKRFTEAIARGSFDDLTRGDLVVGITR
jgi:hypothetical protein